MAVKINGKVTVGCPLPACPASGVEWRTFQFHIHDFADLSTTKGHYIASPKFNCNGHQWELCVLPGGSNKAAEGEVSVYLNYRSKGHITTRYGIKIINKFGETAKEASSSERRNFICDDNRWGWGWNDFISRSVILDESNNILDSNDTLTVVVSIEVEPTTVFVPKNPLVRMMKDMFNNENTADVCFEVSAAQETEDDDGAKRIKTTTPFYAHRTILQGCAPMLAAICGSNNDSGGVVTASVDDVKPDIFRHLLSYVYGGSVPKEELKAHAKDVIDAADKYSIVNLKLEAEAAYVDFTSISIDNAMDNLLYADSRNCALLKETVMNFLADNHSEAASHISFTDCPGHVVKDLLIAFGRNSKKDSNGTKADELATLSVSELRRRLNEKGLEVDGSREAMIESIKSHS